MSEAHLFAAMTFIEIYERVLVPPLFRPFAEELVSRLTPATGDSLIDVACGTGIVARIGRERLGQSARIVGVDVSPAMLNVARTVDPSIDWREGNATDLPIDEERFSLLTCHQGLQFMPDKAAVVREMRRVLAPRGRLAVATFRPLEDLPGMRALNAVVERHVGPIADSRHSFGHSEPLRALLLDGGFSDVTVTTFDHSVRFADGVLFARLNAMAAIGMSDQGKAMSEAERSELAGRIASESADLIARSTKDGTFILPLTTNIATGRA